MTQNVHGVNEKYCLQFYNSLTDGSTDLVRVGSTDLVRVGTCSIVYVLLPQLAASCCVKGLCCYCAWNGSQHWALLSTHSAVCHAWIFDCWRSLSNLNLLPTAGCLWWWFLTWELCIARHCIARMANWEELICVINSEMEDPWQQPMSVTRKSLVNWSRRVNGSWMGNCCQAWHFTGACGWHYWCSSLSEGLCKTGSSCADWRDESFKS